MSKENDVKKIIKYCVHCGAKADKNQIYCPQCGKLIIKMKPSKEISQEKHIYKKAELVGRAEISRKCSGCGSIITSTILNQCPICNSMLEPLPELQKPVQRKSGFIFIDKKLEPEQRFTLNKESWKLKEGLNVFTNSLLIYITVQLLFIMLFWFQIGSDNQDQSTISEITIFLILLSQIPGMLLGIFPLWYISSRRHKFEKLGFSSDRKKNLLALVIGIIGGFSIIVISIFSSYINSSLLYEIGLNFFDIQTYIDLEYKIIRESGLWTILLLIELIIVSISTEIVFRGVLHNTLKEKFENDNIKGKISIILIVALVYAGIFLLFSFPIGLYFILSNFLVFVFLGILYEINRNLLNTIIASVLYNILIIFLIFYF
jgi:membrane protease YdiL (CAAX protease family)/predicted RNA-binding Zn-ribbon protein involved in translation (DUF1610 family)